MKVYGYHFVIRDVVRLRHVMQLNQWVFRHSLTKKKEQTNFANVRVFVKFIENMALSKPLRVPLENDSNSDFDDPSNKRFRELSDQQLSELQVRGLFGPADAVRVSGTAETDATLRASLCRPPVPMISQ